MSPSALPDPTASSVAAVNGGDQLSMMIDKIPTLAWSCRPDGTTEFLNQRWLDYTGLSLEASLGLEGRHPSGQFYYDLPAGPFYGYNRPGAKPSQGVIWNWWRQGMMGGAKAHYDGIVAFSQTDFTADLKKITVPVLVMHGDDDQIVPYADSAPLSAKLLRNSTLKTYEGFPHGMPTTEAETINADLLSFLKAHA